MKEALKLALEALEDRSSLMRWQKARDAVKEALAQDETSSSGGEQEPVKLVSYNCKCGRTMNFESVHGVVAPQEQQSCDRRPWVGLTDEERDAIFDLNRTKLGGWDYGGDEVMYDDHFEDAVAAIEAKLKAKNGFPQEEKNT